METEEEDFAEEQLETLGGELGPGLGEGGEGLCTVGGRVPGELGVQAACRARGVKGCRGPGDTSAPVMTADGELIS